MKRKTVASSSMDYSEVGFVDGHMVSKCVFVDEVGRPAKVHLKAGQTIEVIGDAVLVDGEQVSGVRAELKLITDEELRLNDFFVEPREKVESFGREDGEVLNLQAVRFLSNEGTQANLRIGQNDTLEIDFSGGVSINGVKTGVYVADPSENPNKIYAIPKPGHFYWVLPVLDVDSDEDWANKNQPALFLGDDRWVLLGTESEENWPVRWVGPEITLPK